ncbi:FliM/FliN family flagellar motor switch protein [Paraburkholderia sp. BR10882]|uniref:FliM/FliN family flagellar motor switch protein n=1 Tax=unclassified Paraburkholderia TaxID=2615204 RepID=UPI0034CE5124
MSQPLNLRILCKDDLQLYLSMRALQSSGRAAALRKEAPPLGYASLRATYNGHQYDGWVDLLTLARRHYPGLDQLAWCAVDERYLLELFGSTELTEVLFGPEGDWSEVRLTGVVRDALPVQTLLCLEDGGRAKALFRNFPYPPPELASHSAAHVNALPLSVRFCIGATYVPLNLLHRINVGDVLIVQCESNRFFAGGELLAGFNYEGVDIVLKESLEPLEVTDIESVNIAVGGTDAKPFSVDALRVRVDFTLDERTMAVADIARLHPGAVIPLRSSAVTQIAMRANNHLFATGELVRVGEQLAVEIRTLLCASPEPSRGE